MLFTGGFFHAGEVRESPTTLKIRVNEENTEGSLMGLPAVYYALLYACSEGSV